MAISKQHIPKIIHHIAPADKSKWHPLWERCYESWIKAFPNFEFNLWNDDSDLDDLIETHFPQFIKSYRNFSYKIMKINFARFALLNHYGGIYADMDIFCYNNFCDILDQNDLFLIQNFLSETVNGHFPFEICLMAASKENSYMLDCMSNSVDQFNTLGHLFNKSSIDTEWLIVMLTDAIAIQSRDMHNADQISLFPYETFNNRAASYDKSFFTKHMRSSSWNRSVVPNKYIITDNLMFAVSDTDETTHKLLSKMSNYNVVNIHSFDFYHDYSNGNFFTGNFDHDILLKKQTQQLYNRIVS